MSGATSAPRRRSIPGVGAIALAAQLLAACPGDVDLGDTFPCRAPEDCVEGFVCHPERWICVPADELDGGATDAE